MTLQSPIRRPTFALRCLGAAVVLAALACNAEPNESPLKHVAGAASTSSVLPEPNPGQPASAPNDESVLRAQLLSLVNAERAKAHLNPLTTSDALSLIADYHTSRMIDGNFFAHTDPYDRSTASGRAGKFDYPYLKIGENLAAGQETPQQVVTEWLASDAHRKVLLDSDFREAGIGVLDGGRYGRYWTLMVATRADQ